MTCCGGGLTDDMHGAASRYSTRRLYLQAIQQFAQLTDKSPDQGHRGGTACYFLYHRNDKPYVFRSTSTIALTCAIKFFYERGRPASMAELGLHPPSVGRSCRSMRCEQSQCVSLACLRLTLLPCVSPRSMPVKRRAKTT